MTRHVVDGRGYEVRDRGVGPTVLFIHGFTGRGADWSPFLAAVHRDGYRSIVVDLLGHGRSDAPADPTCHAVERQAADLAELLRRLSAAPAVVVGYSLGARVALGLAMTAPEVAGGLVLESPSAGIVDAAERAARRAADAALAVRLERDGLEAFLRAWEAAPLFAGEHRLPAARRARIHAARARNRPAALAASLRGAGQGSMVPLFDHLGAIRVPTLVVGGGLDPVGLERARGVAAGIPGARLVVFDHLGHAPHREAPATFRHLLIEQLAAWRDPAA